jgi:trehalose-phosphatase
VARRQIDLLVQQLGPPRGERIEDKGPIVAVHTRNTNPERREHVERVVRAVQLPELELIAGRRELEQRPAGGPTKGDAVRTIAATRPGATILYIGDDTTDEDAFKVLGDEDFPVLVDDEHAHSERPTGAVTHARYAVDDTDAVARVLDRLGAEASCPT